MVSNSGRQTIIINNNRITIIINHRKISIIINHRRITIIIRINRDQSNNPVKICRFNSVEIRNRL